MRDKIFYASSFGFMFGVFLRSFTRIDIFSVFFVALLSFVFILFFTFIAKRQWGIILSVLVLFLSLGVTRFHIADKLPSLSFDKDIGSKVVFSGMVVDEPVSTEKNRKIILEVKTSEEKTKILVTASLDLDINYGDEISVSGVLEKPENFVTDQGKEFDYVNYLRKDGIFYLMRYSEIEVLSVGNGNYLKSLLFSAKEKFLSKIDLSIREPESLLMGGLILGEKSALSESLRKSFVDTGTIHMVALSGYNVTIIAEWIMKLFFAFPQSLSIGAGIISIFLFVLMTGASSTAVRAGIMAILALFARATGRNYDVARALILVGVVMVLVNPFVLYFDVSFQLSFIATVAVIFFAPRVERYFSWVTPRLGLRDIISVTSAVYIFVLPFILYKMGSLSLVALPANILILPFIPITMVFGFITGFTGMIWYILSVPFGYISYLLLHYELVIVDFFANIPFASLSIPNFSLVLTVLIYFYFAYLLFNKNIRSSIKKQ